MDFKAQSFIRCHSMIDHDSADISTQVWQAEFKPSMSSNLVATCGGNKICVIDVESSSVEYRYTWLKGKFYTLSWSTACPDNHILAAAGMYNTIVFIDLSTKSAYLHYKDFGHKSFKIFISSILFHPDKNILFCAQNDGSLYVLNFEIENRRIINLNKQSVVDLKCEIFGLAFCTTYDCLLIATNTGLMGWTNSQKQKKKLIVFELPENPNNLYKEQNEKVIDSIEIIKNDWIATKIALHGVLYIFNLSTVMSTIKNNQCRVKPAYVLKWSDTDNYFMGCGIGVDGKLLACGDDQGSIWMYDLTHINFKVSNQDTKTIDPHTVIKWPLLFDPYLKKKKKLEVDINGIVIAKCAVHPNGKFIVAVTNNNFVCIYALSSTKI